MPGRYPGCTNGGACVSDVQAVPLMPLPVEAHLIGTGATIDESGAPPVREDFDLNAQPPGEIRLTWVDAVFVQELRGVGAIWLRLSEASPSQNVLGSVDLGQTTFFPARSRTSFFWRLEIPRLGWRLENRLPMVTETISPHLLSYPVQRAWYRVPDQTRFDFITPRLRRFAHVRVGTRLPVVFGPFSTFLTGSITLDARAGEQFTLRATIDPYNHVPGPSRLKVAWYLRDSAAGGDYERPVRGIVTVRRGVPTTFTAVWTRVRPPARPPSELTLVLLSLRPDVPGHAEIDISLPN